MFIQPSFDKHLFRINTSTFKAHKSLTIKSRCDLVELCISKIFDDIVFFLPEIIFY